MPPVAINKQIILYTFMLSLLQKYQGKKGGKPKAKKTTLRFTIDCSTPVEDEIMDAGAFVSDCQSI